jgi:hypothetical protein
VSKSAAQFLRQLLAYFPFCLCLCFVYHIRPVCLLQNTVHLLYLTHCFTVPTSVSFISTVSQLGPACAFTSLDLLRQLPPTHQLGGFHRLTILTPSLGRQRAIRNPAKICLYLLLNCLFHAKSERRGLSDG